MFLGINMAVEPFSIALLKNDKVLFSYALEPTYEFTENLVAKCDHYMKACSVSFSDLDAIGIIDGPGSYMGLRLSLAQVKTMLMVLQKPVYVFSAFEAMLFACRGDDQFFVGLLPARRKEFNVVLGKLLPKGVQFLTKMFSLKEASLLQALERFKQPIQVMGVFDQSVLQLCDNSDQLILTSCFVDAVSVSKLAAQSFQRGDSSEFRTLVPRYSHQPV